MNTKKKTIIFELAWYEILKYQDESMRLKMYEAIFEYLFYNNRLNMPKDDNDIFDWLMKLKTNHSVEKHRLRNSAQYKEWREAVLKRDGYACSICGKKDVTLHVHHLKSFSKFKDLRFDISNGIALCLDCHQKSHKKQD